MNWKLTTDLCGEPFVKFDEQLEEDLTLGYTFLRLLAEEDNTLVEIAPGVWRHGGSGAEGVLYQRKEREEDPDYLL
jgi:hypothetical protein